MAAKGEQQVAVGGATAQTPAPQVPAPVPQQQGGMMDRFRGMTTGQQLASGGAGAAALGGGYALGRGTAPDPTIGNMTRYYANRDGLKMWMILSSKRLSRVRHRPWPTLD